MSKNKKILVIGSQGNMGKRYMLILKHLGHSPFGFDLKKDTPTPIDEIEKYGERFDGIIIATPTSHHLNVINLYKRSGLPILCEKPFTNNYKRHCEMLHEVIEDKDLKIRMVNQYEYYENKRLDHLKIIKEHEIHELPKITKYNYFKTGQDGLLYDCINILGLAKHKFDIQNNSPIWQCTINGFICRMDQMDHAYVWNVKDWLEKFDSNKEYIIKAHEKVWSLM
jgi:hypothetical protein